MNRAGIQQVAPVESPTSAAGKVSDAGSVIDVGAAPLGQNRG